MNEFGFWIRMALTAVLVNVPTVWAVYHGVLVLPFALGYSMVAGMCVLLTWDATRRPAADAMSVPVTGFRPIDARSTQALSF